MRWKPYISRGQRQCNDNEYENKNTGEVEICPKKKVDGIEYK